MKYIVSYTVDRYYQGDTSSGENGLLYRPEGYTFIVQAEDKVQAFIAAYENLTANGHMVCTAGPFYGRIFTAADGREEEELALAGLSTAEMKKVYEAGIPPTGYQRDYSNVAMTHIERIEPYKAQSKAEVLPTAVEPLPYDVDFINLERIKELKRINSRQFDLTRLIRLCEELNICYADGCFLATAMLTRAILDHVPPIFGCNSFANIANNYQEGCKSFRQCMQHLEKSSRKIANLYLHSQIREKVLLPNKTQVNFTSDLDLLLAEIERVLR
jgi:hypothetical protein